MVVDSEDEDEDNEPESESVIKHVTVDTSRSSDNTNSNAYVPPRSDQKSCEGGCVNGYCDSKTGRCVCDLEHYGPRCDKLKSSEHHTSNTGNNGYSTQSEGSYLYMLMKLM